MKDFQKRVLNEKKELDLKLDKLIEFIQSEDRGLSYMFGGLSVFEQSRLRRQQVIMELYSEILSKRINNFT